MKITRRHLICQMGAGLAAQTVIPATYANAAPKRNTVTEVRETDVLVCGGGPAGIAAALTAARQGARVLLVERYGRLGGMAVNAMVSPIMGNVKSPVVDEIIRYLGGRRISYESADLSYADLVQKADVNLLLHAWAMDTLAKDHRVTGVRLLTKQGLIDVNAHVTIDATGDGDIAFAAGAVYEQGRGAGPQWEADGLLQPMTIMFRVGGVKYDKSMLAHGGRSRYRFPDGRRWVDITAEDHKKGLLPPNVARVRIYPSIRKDERVINATQINGVDGTKVDDLTVAELEGRRQAFQVIDYLRKRAPGYENAYISEMPAAIGVRETRRILGRAYLEASDLIDGRKWPDAVVRDACFPIDIHNPTGAGQVAGASAAHPLGKDPTTKPYDIPYGCLIPRNVEGLLVAGRCISGSHEAHASYRVQAIAMAIGAAAGVAAALAAHDRQGLAQVNAEKMQQILFG